MNEFDKFDDSISKEFYSDIVSTVEKFYNESRTFGERALIGDIITMINNKCVVKKDNKLERKFNS